MAARMAAANLPELLRQGMKIYEGLKEEITKVMMLKEYAQRLANIVQTMKEVNEHLSDEEKKAYAKLTNADKLAQIAMTKAEVVISTIKSQSEALVAALEIEGEDVQTLRDACLFFAAFARDIKPVVGEAQTNLNDAICALRDANSTITSIVSTLKRVHDGLVNEMKQAKAEKRKVAYGTAAVGIIAGPIGLMISYGVAAGVCEGLNIPQIEKGFEDQRNTMQGYIAGFEHMGNSANTIGKNLETKRKQLVDIEGKMNAVDSLARTAGIQPIPGTMIKVVLSQARELVQKCG